MAVIFLQVELRVQNRTCEKTTAITGLSEWGKVLTISVIIQTLGAPLFALWEGFLLFVERYEQDGGLPRSKSGG